MADLSIDGTKIVDNYDRFTGVPFNATKTTTWYDGSDMDDTKVDNAIYFKNTLAMGGGYSKRDFEDAVIAKWYSGDQNALTTEALQNLVSISNDSNARISVDSTIQSNPDGTDLLENQITGLGKIEFNGATIYKKELPIFGIPQNIEQKLATYENPILDGVIQPPPMGCPAASKGVQVMAHWYNDFGLQSNLANSSAYKGWYDWRWNHTDVGVNPTKGSNVDPYDPQRHPLLGWYRGDDVNVLDWQCYWLSKYGVTDIIITNVVRESTFADTPASSKYWVYQLFNKTKNFKNANYTMWLDYLVDDRNVPAQVEAMNAQQEWLINTIYSTYKNCSIYIVNGKRYPVFFIFDLAIMRGVYDNYVGSTVTRARLLALNDMVKALGYDGMAIICRNLEGLSVWSQSSLDAMKASGLILLSGEYTKYYDINYTQYADYADNMPFPVGDKKKVLSVMTSGKTKKPHPSSYNMVGTTPQLFSLLMNRAIDHISINALPKIITIYNVAEWAEAGPGLQPNQYDGFGYLEAIQSIKPLPVEHIEGDLAGKANLKGGNTFTEGAQVLNGSTIVSLGLSDAQTIKSPTHYRTIGTGVSTVGAIVIKHPVLATNTGFSVKLKAFIGGGSRIEEVQLRFEQPNTVTVIPRSAIIITGNSTGISFISNINVGIDGSGNIVMVLNQVSTNWGALSHVVVDEIITFGAGGVNSLWRNGWTASIETDLTGYTLSSVPITNIVSNLAIGTVTTTTIPVINSYGTGFNLPAATSVLAGLITAASQELGGSKRFSDLVTVGDVNTQGQLSVNPGTDARIGIAVTAKSSTATANLYSGRTASGVTVFSVSPTGVVLAAGTPTANSHLINLAYANATYTKFPFEFSSETAPPTLAALNALSLTIYPVGCTINYTNSAVLMSYTRIAGGWLEAPISKKI